VGRVDSLAMPEVSFVQLETLGVASAKAFGHVGVVDALSVAEFIDAEGHTEGESKNDAAGGASHVGVVVIATRLA